MCARWFGALTICVFGVVVLGNPTQAAAQLVRDWDAPTRIVIEGSKHWPAESVRSELVSDVEVIAAAHPMEDLDQYTRVLADRLREGYWNCGFPEAKASARVDEEAKKIVLTVVEGPQYIAGKIDVQGAKTVDVARLVAGLNEKQPPSTALLAGLEQVDGTLARRWIDKQGNAQDLHSALWAPGKPIRFGKLEDESRTAGIERALAEQGYPRAKFDAAISRGAGEHTGDLVIVIDDEGPATKVDRIDVVGSDRDAPADVIDFLGVKIGQPITAAECAAWTEKLWSSGRYLEHEVKVIPPSAEDQPTILQIRLVNYKHAPALRKALSADEALMMKCREWILASIERGDVMVVRGDRDGMQFEMATARQQGVYLLFDSSRSPPFAAPEAPLVEKPPAMLFAATPGELLHAYAGAKAELRAPLFRMRGLVSFGLAPRFDPEDETQTFETSLGLGAKTQSQLAGQAPVVFSVSLAPVAMLGLLHQPNTKISDANGVLTIERETVRCKIERETGRLLEFAATDEETSGIDMRISFEPRTFAECLAAARRKVTPGREELPNAFQPNRPISSSLEFLCESPVLNWPLPARYDQPEDSADAQWLRHMRPAKKLLAADVLAPLDEWFAGLRKSIAEEYSISWRDSTANVNVNSIVSLTWGNLLGGLAIRGADQAFPRDSWPWTLSRGAALAVMQKSKFVATDLERLLASKEMGPVGRWATAALVEYVDGEIAARFAMSGIEQWRLVNFRLDYTPLIDPKSGAGQMLTRIAEVVRELNDDEAAELGRALLGKHANLLVVAAAHLREHKDEPIERSLPRALDHVWGSGLSDLIAEQLKAIYLRNLKVARDPATRPT